MRPSRKHVAIILCIAVVVIFTNLGSTRLWDRDEPCNAGCAREMMQRQDYIVPWFNNELRVQKPALLYWLIISAYEVFGVNEFAARFWSAVAAVGTALCTYAIGRRLFNTNVGLWGAILLLTSLLFEVVAHAATPDSVLLFFCTAAICTFVLGHLRRTVATEQDADEPADYRFTRIDQERLQQPLDFKTAIVLYSLLGCAMLAKGPVGLVMPAAVIGMFLLVVRIPKQPIATSTGSIWPLFLRKVFRPFAPRHFLSTCWAMRPITAMICSLAVAMPWYIWVGLRTDGEFLQSFFIDHHFARATNPSEGQHGSALFYYPASLLIGFFPWSVFSGPTVMELMARIRRSLEGKLGLIFCTCWVLVWVITFSCLRTKWATYVAPCYPALALATAVFLQAWLRGSMTHHARWPRISLVVLIAVGIAMMVVFPILSRRFLPGEESLAVIGLIPISIGIATLWFMARERRIVAGYVLCGGAVLFSTFFFGHFLVRVDDHQQNELLFQAIRDNSDNPEVGASDCMESSWVFYGGWPVQDIALMAARNANSSKPKNGVPTLDDRSTFEVVDFLTSKPERFVITTKRRYSGIQSYLPVDVVILAEVPYFLKKEQLVVLGRAKGGATMAHTTPETLYQR